MTGDHLLARTIAGHGAQAFENARLYQASQERSAYLTALHAISKTVVSSLELQTVLRQVLRLTCRTLEATEGFILLLEQVSDGLLFAMTLTDKTKQLRGQRLPPGQGIASVVVKRGKPVRIADVRQYSRFETDLDEITGLETRSVLCAPLIYRGQIIGAIEVVNNCQNKFGGEDLNLLLAVASFAATALQNAHLYTASETRANELAILHEIGLALSSTLEYEAVVKLALSLIRSLFGANRTVLYSLDPQTGRLDSTAMESTPDDEEVLNMPAQSSLADRVAWSVLEEHRSLLIKNSLKETWLLETVPALEAEPDRSLMAVPLFVSGQPIGVLVVLNNDLEAYTLDDLRTLYAISTIVAMALQNAQLYARQKQLLEQQAKAQAHLIRTEKMVALGRLAAAIMHEINNPLQAVRGFLELAHKAISSQEQFQSVDRYLTIANEEVIRISTMARRLYDFYSPASEEMRPTDLQTALASVLALANKELQRCQITVTRTENPDLPLVEGRPDQLRQVFLNLVLNAIEAMPDGGTLQLNSARVNSANRPMVSFEFNDTGQGMSEETKARLFEPFFTTKSERSGLGMSISYSIIQAHQGRISVVSHEGLGTTITILLPVRQSSQ
jgi:two-component system NtrC family sensor kinase